MIAAGWRPSVANYLGRVPKARVIEAVREAKGEQTAELLGHLKKAELAAWLPEPLRPPEEEAAQDGGGEVTLPAFLADDDEGGTPAGD